MQKPIFTNKYLAEAAVKNYDCSIERSMLKAVTAEVLSAIEYAVDQEREACAVIAQVKVDRPWPETAVEAAKEISARIRARSDP